MAPISMEKSDSEKTHGSTASEVGFPTATLPGVAGCKISIYLCIDRIQIDGRSGHFYFESCPLDKVIATKFSTTFNILKG